MDNKEFIAHRREKDGECQSLWNHLKETSFLAGEFASKINLKKHGELIGLLHDIGKASKKFEQYIRSATGLIDPDEDDYVDAKEKRGKIDHSSAGAQVIYHYFSDKSNQGMWVLQILSLVIASHHSGLIDCLTPDGNDNFSKRMSKPDEKTHIKESISNLDKSIKDKVEELLSNDVLISHLNQKLKSLYENNDSNEIFMLKIGLLTRILFSCLIDADRLNTADFEFPERVKYRNKGSYIEWATLKNKLDIHISKLKNKNKIDTLRQNISEYCFKFSEKPKDLYKLTVPTGGGKTFSSLRFALNHASKHNMERIIYVIPYTSIIDQNAEKTREILEDKNKQGVYLGNVVLEHHSNLMPEVENTKQKLLSENWDAPIVFTTMVQFLETLFGFGTRNARKMHQLANAVIIFDEIQSIPIQCVHLFNIAIRFLIKGCGSTVVLCTATQPLLDKVIPEQRALQILPEHEIIPDVKKLFKELNRVKVYDERKNGGWREEEIIKLAEQELVETGSVLIIVNTKKSAVNLFKLLQNYPETKVFHLSTNMCPAHRITVLKNIKSVLNKKPVICVSTQLIEAGIDIDFGTVIRYLAGLDSIAQAAGRCNRNGTKLNKGRVFIVNPKEENLDKLKDIKVGRDISERVLDEYKSNPKQFDEDILGPKAMERYYNYYFYNRKEMMCYRVDSNSLIGRDDNLFDLLSVNSLSVKEYQRINTSYPKIPLKQSFMTAGKEFQVINSSTRGIIVPYEEEGKRIINELCSIKKLEYQPKLLKKAQRYSVNVFSNMLFKLSENQIIHEVQEGMGIFYMYEQYYSENYGISETVVNELEFLNF